MLEVTDVLTENNMSLLKNPLCFLRDEYAKTIEIETHFKKNKQN